LLAILAGRGSLPVAIASSQNTPPFIVAFKGQTDPAFAANYRHAWARLGGVGGVIHILKKNHITKVVFAGGMDRPPLAALCPDFRALKILYRAGFRLGGDDTLLRLLIAELEGEGMRVVAAQELCPELLLPLGHVAGSSPNAAMMGDIALGLNVALDLGRHDIGQAVIVHQGRVLAVEGVEGTAALIARTAPYIKGRGAVLVKACKPQQDTRADLPAFGAETVRQAAAAGIDAIAGLAGKTLLLEVGEVERLADKVKVTVIGVA
jgi:UDP-2,3-diacylglucosamine hydrolase